jgi:prephenate dehydratase
MTMKVVAIQGQKASFHDIAASQFFDADIELVCCDTFADTFKAVSDGRATHAVCAIENSLYGSINETYDLLVKYDYFITGEVYLRIEQCLIGVPGASVDGIKEVYSHPVALAQCEEYLDAALPRAERFEHHDTAASVEKVKELQDLTIAAIAGRQAAELYDMEIIAESIETDKQNYTHFIVLDATKALPSNATKTSLILKAANTPGALYHVLGAFAKASINLTKLQSRPIIGEAWNYKFHVDVDAGIEDLRLIQALKELDKLQCKVTVLGSYVGVSNTGS